MRRLSVPFVEPLARVFIHPMRRASSADASDVENSTDPDEPSTTVALQEDGRGEPSSTTEQSAVTQQTGHSDADLPLIIQDTLYSYQLSLSKPLLLSPLAFHTASIVWRYKDSQRVYKILQKKGIITAGGEIRTQAINKNFAHHFAYLSGFSRRRIIGLLFWWEEEAQRLGRLMEQETEIKQLLEEMPPDEGGQESAATLLRTESTRTRMLINLKPSERAENDPDNSEPLPAYSISPLASPPFEEAVDPLDYRASVSSH